MTKTRESHHTDDGYEIDPIREITTDKTAFEKQRERALKKSPDHRNMQWIAVPEIKEGTFIIADRRCNAKKIKEAYLRKRGLLKSIDEG